MNEITLDDVGRRVAFLRGADWNWHRQPEGVVVLDVRNTYYQPPGVRVEIGNGNGAGYWYDVADVRLGTIQRDDESDQKITINGGFK